METKHIPVILECGSSADAIVNYDLEPTERDDETLMLSIYSIMIKGIEFVENVDYKNDVIEWFENDNYGKTIEVT